MNVSTSHHSKWKTLTFPNYQMEQVRKNVHTCIRSEIIVLFQFGNFELLETVLKKSIYFAFSSNASACGRHHQERFIRRTEIIHLVKIYTTKIYRRYHFPLNHNFKYHPMCVNYHSRQNPAPCFIRRSQLISK